MRYRWGTYELDVPARRLRDEGEQIHLEPQVFDVLAHLVAHHERVVSKVELFDEVWGSRFVGESALTSRIQAIRRALGDSGREQHTIRTAHGVGYQFVAPLLDPAEEPSVGVPSDDDPSRGGVEARRDGAAAPSRRLPPINDPLRGRVTELAELAELAGNERVVTVLGPGGTGKTRLTVEWAQRHEEERPGGFVDLAAARDGRALGEALALTLGIDVGERGDIVDSCGEYLRSTPHWLILDNCEHVVDDAATLVGRLVAQAPDTTIVTTSRVPLGLPMEVLYRLETLPVPDDADAAREHVGDNAAVALFVDRVRRVQHDFELTGPVVAKVIALCRALDGLPLAIELAAGRVGAFSIDDLLARLDQRLDLLGDSRSARSGRHRSLRTTLEWSYELLDDDSRRLLRHLSVFPAGLPLVGAERLGARLGLSETWDALAGLREASLVNRVDEPYGSRYLQLETMRTFGVDLLDDAGELGAALDFVVDWVHELCADVVETLTSEREPEWDHRIRRELPNIRTARARLLESGRLVELVDVSAALDEWAQQRGVSELWTWTDELLGLVEEVDAADACRIRAISAQAQWRRGRFEQAADLATAVLTDTAATEWATARALSSLAVAELFRGELDRAADAWRGRYEIDGHLIDWANIVLCLTYAGRFDEAQELADEVHAAAVAARWPGAVGWTEYVLGELGAAQRTPGHTEWLQASIRHAEEVGDSFTIGVAGVTLATSRAAEGDTVGAAELLRDLIGHWLRSGTWTQQWTTLRHAAALLEQYDPALALAVLAAADADQYSSRLDADSAAGLAALRDRLVDALGADVAAEVTGTPVERSELAQRTSNALGAMLGEI